MYLLLLGWPVYLFIFVLGLCLGSFINSWIWRTRENIKIGYTRSICPHCRRQLTWYENIPVFSYIWLKGKCRTCRHKISWHYLWIEIVTPVLLTFVAWYHINYLPESLFYSIHLLGDFIFVTILIIIFDYDALYKQVSPGLVWMGALFGFVLNYFALNRPLGSMFLGAAICGGFFLLQYLVSRGRWIGGGDVRIGVMMGVWLGWPNVLVALFIAYIIGAIVSLVLVALKKKTLSSQIPFGSFLAIGTFLALDLASVIVKWYLALLK